jgi:hypothetical protein
MPLRTRESVRSGQLAVLDGTFVSLMGWDSIL